MSLKLWLAGGAAAFVLALLVAIGALRLQLDAANAKAELAEAQRAAADAALTAVQVQADKYAAIDGRLASLDAKLAKRQPTIIREILNAPETDNAPIAPVLLRTLDRLRELCGEAEGVCDPADAASTGEPDAVLDNPTPGDDVAGGAGPVAGAVVP